MVQQRTTNVKEQQERKKEFGQNSSSGGLSKLQRGRPKVKGNKSKELKEGKGRRSWGFKKRKEKAADDKDGLELHSARTTVFEQ